MVKIFLDYSLYEVKNVKKFSNFTESSVQPKRILHLIKVPTSLCKVNKCIFVDFVNKSLVVLVHTFYRKYGPNRNSRFIC